MKQIMVIDDDTYISDMPKEVLEKEGYAVSQAWSGTEALLRLQTNRPDLVLLDLMLPGLSGEGVLAKIQGIPVIVISAKGDVSDKVSLLLGGAADYVTKPFDVRELLARITVCLRNVPDNGKNSLLSFEKINLDTISHQVTVEDCPVKLTKTEYAILKLLLANPSQVISKSVMLDRIAQDTPDCVKTGPGMYRSSVSGPGPWASWRKNYSPILPSPPLKKISLWRMWIFVRLWRKVFWPITAL